MDQALKPQPLMSPAAESYAATALKLSREVQARANVELDIAYGSHNEQKIDLYLPDKPSSQPMPVLLFMHGGYWTHGYKEWMGFMAPAITMLPDIFISVGYRLAPEAKYSAVIQDCRDALKWTHQNIKSFGGDPDRLFVGGHSAGGHLAALLALQRDALKENGLPEDSVKGCFPVSGVFDLADVPDDRRDAFLGDSKDIVAPSPVRQTSGNTVPFFIAIGENDFPNLKTQHPALVFALRIQSGMVEEIQVPGCDHFEINMRCGDVGGVWAKTVREWMAPSP